MSVHPPPESELAGVPEESTGPVHRPYIADSVMIPELNWLSVGLGAILGIIFGASSLYLVLKVGMTVSASGSQISRSASDPGARAPLRG